MPTSQATWWLYLIETKQKQLYTGVTIDVARRFSEHQENSKKSARFLRGKAPLKLVFSTEVGDKSLALRAEIAVKKLPREQKLKLIESGTLEPLLQQLSPPN